MSSSRQIGRYAEGAPSGLPALGRRTFLGLLPQLGKDASAKAAVEQLPHAGVQASQRQRTGQHTAGHAIWARGGVSLPEFPDDPVHFNFVNPRDLLHHHSKLGDEWACRGSCASEKNDPIILRNTRGSTVSVMGGATNSAAY